MTSATFRRQGDAGGRRDGIGMAAMERIEHRDAIGARHHASPSMVNELARSLGGRAGNRRISIGPVVAPLVGDWLAGFPQPDFLDFVTVANQVILYLALLSHFPDERATVPGPQPYLPFGWGFSVWPPWLASTAARCSGCGNSLASAIAF
jgi:hypothetical protein